LNIPILPILKHHAHPFYAIHNALLKLRKRSSLLNLEHYHLFTLMSKIDGMWLSRLARPASQNLALKRRRQPSPGSNNDTNHRQVKSANTGKGKGRARVADNTPSQFREFLSGTSSDSAEPSFYGSSEIVTAWAEEVAAAGPPDVPSETIVWSEKP
jgi:hypothetical protein